MSNYLRGLTAVLVVPAILAVLAPQVAWAKGAPMAADVKLRALPDPPAAPHPDTFLVTVAHGGFVPQKAVFDFKSAAGQTSTNTETFQKLNHYQYQATWRAPQVGHVTVHVYGKGHALLAEGSYPVKKAHASAGGRIVIGAVFIGASLWFWRRQQRYYRR